jgi:hypothetical protein
MRSVFDAIDAAANAVGEIADVLEGEITRYDAQVRGGTLDVIGFARHAYLHRAWRLFHELRTNVGAMIRPMV